MRFLRKRLIWTAAFALAVAISSAAFFYRSFDHWYYLIDRPAVYDLDWSPNSFSNYSKEDMGKILDQPFRYLSEGGQSYVFISQDGKYVIKLFKFHRLCPSPYLRYIPDFSIFSHFKEKQIAKRKRRLEKVFTGHKLAFDLIAEESGLLLVQLKPGQFRQLISLSDSKGHRRSIDSYSAVFVLQKKGEPLNEHFSSLMEKGDIEAVKKKITQIFSLYKREYQNGIYDGDHGMMHNIGFEEKRPLHLDVGSFVYDASIRKKAVYVKELRKVSTKIKAWAEKNYPEFSALIALHINHLLLNEEKTPLDEITHLLYDRN